MNGFIRDRALRRLQARVTKMFRHPAVRFGADQLIRRKKVPHITAAYLEVGASLATEKFEKFGGRDSLGGSFGKIEQMLLKGVLGGSGRIRSQ